MKHMTVFTHSLLLGLCVIVGQISAFTENKEIKFEDLAEQEVSLMYDKRSELERYFDAGVEAFRKSNVDEAIRLFEKAIKSEPNSPQPYYNLGIAYETKGDIDKAIEAHKDAILHMLDYPKSHAELGRLLQSKGDIDNAITHYQQALRYDPNMTHLAITVARLLAEKERFKESVPYFEIAAKKSPDDIQIRFEYANAMNTCNQTEKALAEYLELLKVRPNDSGILYNVAYTYKKLGMIDESMPYYEKTLRIKPDHGEAHFSLGLTYLSKGDFKNGWAEYEYRWNRGSMPPREFKQPQWDGSMLNGKIIFIHAEQGLGDTFQFIRYAKVVKEKYKGIVVVAVQKPLETLIARCCPYIDRVMNLDYMPHHFDYHIPMLSLPYVLKTEIETIPCTDPYIFPDQKLVAEWKEKLSADKNFKIGICWQGNSAYSTPFLRAVVAAKSFSVNKFAPLSHVPGVTIYSLQKETGVNQLQTLTKKFKLVTFDESFDNEHGRFMDTVAVMKNLDLVITVDTSICHLAGALGVPVWVMIPEPPDWRWMLKRTDCPWYPHNMRLFRQQTVGDWDSVIKTVAQELDTIVNGTPLPAAQPTLLPAPIEPEPILLPTLSAEHDLLTHKIQQLCLVLEKEKASPDNNNFMQTLRSIYLLDSMRELNGKKVAALKG